MKGLRFNSGKLRYSLVSPVALRMLVEVLEFGAKKYDSHNWAKGMDWEAQTMDSMMRHIQAWRAGEDNDPETGLPHVSHILCNAMFLAHFVGTKTGNDDRYYKEDSTTWKNKLTYPGTLDTVCVPYSQESLPLDQLSGISHSSGLTHGG